MEKSLQKLSLTDLHALHLEIASRLENATRELKDPFYENDWQYIESSRDFYLNAGADVYGEISARISEYKYPSIEKMLAEGNRFRLM